MRWLVLACALAVLAFGSACGGDERSATTDSTTTAAPLGGIDRLAAEANRAERMLEERVRALAEVESLSDVGPRLEGLELELREAADRLGALQLSPDLDAPRDGLAQALRSLASTLDRIRSDIENLDVGGALDALGGVDLGDAEAAIEEIERLAGG
jgi:hypothetical protein